MLQVHAISRLASLALLVGGGCLAVPPQTGPTGASDSEAATGTTIVTSDSAGQSETGIVAPATSTVTSTAAEVTTSAASDATSEAATGFDTHGFPGWPDEGNPDKCDIYIQDCPRGQKCMPYWNGIGGSWNAKKCVDVVADPKQVGEACTAFGGGLSGEDDCDIGAMCWNVDEQGEGVCLPTCTGAADDPMCPPFSYYCYNSWPLAICIPGCDPLLQACPGDELCVPNSEDTFVCVIDDPELDGQAHDPCEVANGCAKGLVCLDPVAASSACDPAFAGCCEPFCEFPGGPCPAADQQCLQWYDPQMLPPGDPKLAHGVCGVPS